MNRILLKKLREQQLVTEEEADCIIRQEQEPVTVHADLLTLLYAGILLFCSGAGVLIYQHIDTIGHMAVIAGITAICIACFAWSFKKAPPFSIEKVEAAHVLHDYLVLMGSLLLPLLFGYIQYAYALFGERWGLAIFIPMVLLWGAAYYFDHLGVLSLAITNLAAWAGITIAPTRIVYDNDFDNEKLIYTGVILGLFLLGLSGITVYKRIKPHFAALYRSFGLHMLAISLLAGLFHFNSLWIWALVIALASGFAFRFAVREKSYYILLFTLLYTYIALSYLIIRWLDGQANDIIEIGFLYFIISGVGLIGALIYYNRKFRGHAGV